jgi:hypothetical protein
MPSTPSFRPERWLLRGAAAAAVYLASGAVGCRFDRSDRWLDVTEVGGCEEGIFRCAKGLQRCENRRWKKVEDCAAKGLLCDEKVGACIQCIPNSITCRSGDVVACHPGGQSYDVQQVCDKEAGVACLDGRCQNLCEEARRSRSNVGCEYWAADLDNAALGASNNAAAQQFAVVISNPQRDVPVKVRITQDNGEPGDAPAVSVVAEGEVLPNNLRVFKLGPREVDGSPEGEFDTGTGTALTRKAYRIETNFPVVAYQFNPLENASVFSNDASLLKPVSALGPPDAGGPLTPAYVVVGWPQTIARSDNPDVDFGGTELRAFLTVVGTRAETKVRVTTTARVIPGGPVAETPVGGQIEATLGAYDVLNLETGDFNADFTGTFIEANGPLVVFSGSEASDAPTFTSLSKRFCCADHLEEQIDPIRTAGTQFVAAHGPSRTRTVASAGAQVAVVPEPDYFRVVAVFEGDTTVTTTLPPPEDSFVLQGRGAFRTVEATRDFLISSDAPVVLGNVSPSQEAAGIRRGLPGGDPSLLVVPPTEQWRSDYVFLTPDKYAFDFLTVVAPPGVEVTLDGEPLTEDLCEIAPADGLEPSQRGGAAPPFLVYRCQLSFATIDPTKSAPTNLLPGEQNDGVHRVSALVPVGVLVSGFDSFVSYSYAAGTQLKELNIQ